MHVEQTLTLDRTLAGTAGVRVDVDMEPVVRFMTVARNQAEGKSGPPTSAELSDSREGLLAAARSEGLREFEEDKQDLQSRLPAGVKLLSARLVPDNLNFAASMVFGFTHASRLSAIVLPKRNGLMPGSGAAAQSPFGGLQVVDDGKTVLLTARLSSPTDPADGTKHDAPTQAQLLQLFDALRVVFRITAPFKVLEHNATDVEGDTLVWDYDVARLTSMSPAEKKQGIRVRYRK